jgi:dGTP triphosphohydrolase
MSAFLQNTRAKFAIDAHAFTGNTQVRRIVTSLTGMPEHPGGRAPQYPHATQGER